MDTTQGEESTIMPSTPALSLTASRDLTTSQSPTVDHDLTIAPGTLERLRVEAQMIRQEARSDLDRTRATLIELIEQVRNENSGDHHTPGSAPGPSIGAFSERLAALEDRINRIEVSVARSFERQNELAATMEALLDTVMAERRGEPVAGLRIT